MANTLLTVIIPVLNRKNKLWRTLMSISSQDHIEPGRISLIIVDNGSTDGDIYIPEAWIKKDAPQWLNVTMVKESRPGTCAARNRGLAEAQSDWVMFFDSDDLMKPNHLHSVIESIENANNADVIYWDVAYETEDGKCGVHRKAGRNIWFNAVMRGILSTQRYCCRRKTIQWAGRWNEELWGWNDWELSLRLIGSGARLQYHTGKPTVTVMVHRESITGESFTSGAGKWEASMAIAREYAQRAGLDYVVQLIDMKGAVLAGDYAREGSTELSHRLLNKLYSHGDVSRWRLRFIAGWQRIAGRWSSVALWLTGGWKL